MVKKEILIFIICLVIAFALWIVHQLNQTYIRQYELNVFITQVPIVYKQDSIYIPVKIKVKGSGLKIILLENHFPKQIYIPLRKLKRINRNGLYSISEDNIIKNENFPVKIKITEIQPDTISIGIKKRKK